MTGRPIEKGEDKMQTCDLLIKDGSLLIKYDQLEEHVDMAVSGGRILGNGKEPGSYTHMGLPTKRGGEGEVGGGSFKKKKRRKNKIR